MPRRIKVDPNKRRGHRTIAAAVAVAARGDEIELAPGTYLGPVVLNRPVRLTAEPGTVTVEARDAFALRVLPAAAGTTVCGLHIVGSGGHAAVAVEAAACAFETCVIDAGAGTALWSIGSSEVTLQACRLTSAASFAVHARGAQLALRSCEVSAPANSVGVDVAGASFVLDGCSFAGFGGNAVRAGGSVSGRVQRCTFRDARSNYPAVFVDGRADVTVEDCRFEGLAAPAIMYSAARGHVAQCTFSSLGANAVKAVDGASITVRDLAAVDVAQSVVLVQSGGDMQILGARMSGRLDNAVLVEARSRADISDLDVSGCANAAVAVIGPGASLTLSRAALRGSHSNVLKVADEASCRATGLAVESGEVDFPLVLAEASVSIASSTIRGGAEAAIVHRHGDLELIDVTVEGAGGAALLTTGSTARVERCTVSDVGTGIEASGGCRLSVVATEMHGGDHGVVAAETAVVRLTDTTVLQSRRSGVLVEHAKAVLTSTRVEGSRGDGVVIGEDAAVELRGVTILASAGVGLRSAAPLTLQDGSVELRDNAGGDMRSPTHGDGGIERTLDELLAELDQLVGLDSVKKKVRSLLNVIRLRQREADLGRRSEPITLHAVFTGPPGTGKTTVARLYGELLHAMGFLNGGGFHEVTRADLVVGYIGQTASNVRQKLTAAMGGVLFIDEAYALAQVGGSHTDFGEEAINELVPLMENHRRDIAVIAAGYADEMAAFLDNNPGLRSRFAAIIEFPSYCDEELMEILMRSLTRQDRTATPGALAAAAEYFAALPRGREFPNARAVRQLLHAVVEAIANRVADSEDFTESALSTVVEADVRLAVVELTESQD